MINEKEVLINTIKTSQDNILEIQQSIKETTSKLLPILLKELFESHADLEMIVWSQFDGEYNDEGPYPGIEAKVIRCNSIIKEDLYYSSGNQKLNQDIRNVFNSLDDNAMFKLFGSYTYVAASRNKISSLDVELYDYDVDWEEVWQEMQ